MDLFTYCQTRKGFNYTPSYSTTGYETWMNFDKDTWRREIRRGKDYFPNLNFLRVWLDWDAYQRDSRQFMKNFETALEICEKMAIDLHPTLFNRWHNFKYDYGGIYYDHLLDRRATEIGTDMQRVCFKQRFGPYIQDMVHRFQNDQRIGMWDLCNEPQQRDVTNSLHQLEVDWLKWIAGEMRASDVKQPITIGTMSGTNVEWVANLCDVICIHPYAGWWDEGFAKLCDWALELARKLGKPIIASETCQGSLDDATRVKIITHSLGALKNRGIGWCAWTLHAGRMIAANRDMTDNNCRPGDQSYMAFIEADGTLRPGHEVFNDF